VCFGWLVPIGHCIEIPVLHLENADAHAGIEHDEVRTQPVEMRLDVYLPVGGQLTNKKLKYGAFACGQGLS